MSAIEKSYQYKVSRNGVYLGLLPNVKSPFQYSQDINTPSAELMVTLPINLDIAQDAVEPLQTEAGDIITTEDGTTPITTEGAVQILGTKDSGQLIANGNDIDVYEFSDYHPNGVLAFSGFQQSFDADFEAGLVELSIISNGKDLADYIYGNTSVVLQVSQTSTDTDNGMWETRRYGQTFVTGGSQTDVAQIIIEPSANSAGPRTFTLKLWNNPADAVVGGTPLGSTSQVVTGTSFAEVTFAFSTVIPVLSATSYFFTIEVDSGSIFGDVTTWGGFKLSTASSYANGGLQVSNSGGAWSASSTDDMYFKVYSGTILSTAVFTAYDPAQMVRDAVTGYISQGGDVTYTGSSVVNTGYSLNYTFITATVQEIIEKARELSPSDWYWYVDPATQILYFKETSTTADHQFLLGRHITALRLGGTIKYIKNDTYFTGGPTGGVNLLKRYTDTDSLATDRVGLQRLSDNRILAVDEASAEVLSTSSMDSSQGETFQTKVEISAETYDISTINLGQSASIGNVGNFVDTIVLQITSVTKKENTIVLGLGRLPFKDANYVDKIKRDLENQQTLDNPTAPV